MSDVSQSGGAQISHEELDVIVAQDGVEAAVEGVVVTVVSEAREVVIEAVSDADPDAWHAWPVHTSRDSSDFGIVQLDRMFHGLAPVIKPPTKIKGPDRG
jgi:hypothetical protein